MGGNAIYTAARDLTKAAQANPLATPFVPDLPTRYIPTREELSQLLIISKAEDNILEYLKVGFAS